MGVLYKQSWHSKHAGQTVDDAVDRVWELVDQWNDMHARLNIMESELNTQRATSAQGSNAKINTIQPIQINGQNASNVILENSNGNFTRYVSLLNNGKIYVFKIDGKTMNDVTSNEIESVLKTVKY